VFSSSGQDGNGCEKPDASQEKASFFEKKDQKTFAMAVAGLSWQVHGNTRKVFCFFFSKKKACLLVRVFIEEMALWLKHRDRPRPRRPPQHNSIWIAASGKGVRAAVVVLAAAATIVNLPAISVDRGEGWIIQKLGQIDQASHAAVGAEYHLIFEGHDPLVFPYLGAARERAKEPPPEKAEIAEAAADPGEETSAEIAPAEES
jgi:hypothetical protein